MTRRRALDKAFPDPENGVRQAIGFFDCEMAFLAFRNGKREEWVVSLRDSRQEIRGELKGVTWQPVANC